MMASGIQVHCFPSVDNEFRETARRLVADGYELVRSTDELIRELEATLRQRYPSAIVRQRDAVAELGAPGVKTLYAFRDGRAA